MVLNYIWIAFFLIAFAFGIVGLIMGDTTLFQKMVDATSDSAKTAFEVSLGLTGVLSLWLGIMKIGEKAGMVNMLARMLSPVFTKLFPDIPKNHPVMGSIFMNIASNMLGLDNAATPTGLKAMAQMQELNPKKDTATNPMIMFLVLNTSGLTIIPTSILATHRCFCTHLACNNHSNTCWNYNNIALATHKYLSTSVVYHHFRTTRNSGFHYMGTYADAPKHYEYCYIGSF